MIYSSVALGLLVSVLFVPTLSEVVPISGSRTYSLTYEQARSRCTDLGGSLATYGDLLGLMRNGISYCACGWLADRTARFPMNHSDPGCNGMPGVHECRGRNHHNGFCYLGEISKCSKPLGIENGTVTDHQITASSAYKIWWGERWAPRLGRLNKGGFINAWIPAHDDVNQYLQFDLGRPMAITGILTQGVSRWTRDQYVTMFRVAFSKDGANFFFQYDGDAHKIFLGNYDKHSVVRNTFNPPILARHFRFYPFRWVRHPAIRMELLGCTFEEYDRAQNASLDTEVLLNE